MEAIQKLTAIRKMLPHGAIIKIATRAGVLAPTVSRALKGDTRSPKLPEIIKATAEYLTEFKEKENEAIQALYEALNIEYSEQFAVLRNQPNEKTNENKSSII